VNKSSFLALAIPIFLLIFLAQPVLSYTYLNIYIDSSGTADFLGETNETNLSLPSGISLQNGKITGTTQTLTTKDKDTWKFTYFLRNSEIKAILPEGATVKKITTGEVFLERDRISVYFLNGATIFYTVSDVPISESLSNNNSALLMVLIIIIIAGAFYYWFKLRKKPAAKNTNNKPKKVDKLGIISQVLNDRDKLIIDKLKTTGKVKMSHLRKLCDMPKASFSRHVQELEKKRLLKRSGEGKNKFVELVKR